MRIHFGAFNCPIDGWLNTDITPHLRIARVPFLPWLMHRAGAIPNDRYQDYRRGSFRRLRYLNVGKLWPFADNSVDAIFSSHVVEHLPLRAARVCMGNAHRVLRRGGVIRVVVPDLDKFVSDYRADDSYRWATDLFEADNAFEKNMHHFMYNEESMRRLLRDAGFSRIERRSFGVGQCPDLDLLDNRPESLFMEAVK